MNKDTRFIADTNDIDIPCWVNSYSGSTIINNTEENNIVINGFNIKQTVLEVLRRHEGQVFVKESLAEEIEQALAEKLKLVQGGE